MARPHEREMPAVNGEDISYAKPLGQRNERRIHEPELDIGVVPHHSSVRLQSGFVSVSTATSPRRTESASSISASLPKNLATR